MPNGVYVEGLRDVVRSLERYGVQVADLKAAFKKIGNMVASEAKSLAPRRSGSLAESIRPSNTKNKSLIRAGSARVPYAGVIHYGWPGHNIEPHPFLTDAVDKSQDEAVRLMEQELESLAKRLDLN